jgi:hypothetical protein
MAVVDLIFGADNQQEIQGFVTPLYFGYSILVWRQLATKRRTPWTEKKTEREVVFTTPQAVHFINK